MIVFSRIDDRLIHGQVVTTWVNMYKIEQIIILNDKIADDKIQKNILSMAAPQNIKVKVFPINKFAEIIKTNEITRKTMLLFSNSIDVMQSVKLGVPIDKLNVGGMRSQPGRERLTKTLAVDEKEREAFNYLLNDGVEISVQMVPNDEKIDLKGVI